MRLRLSILSALMIMLIIACQGPPPTQIVIVISPTPQGGVVTPTPVTGIVQNVPTATSTAPPTKTPAPSPTFDPFPTATINQIQVAEERFQNGRMFWLAPTGQIWVMINGADATRGQWAVYDDSFVDGQPEFDPSLTPPAKMLQPIRGFGKLWREHPEIKQALGWALEQEVGQVTRYEYHPGGSVDAQNVYHQGLGYHILVSVYGDVFRFNEASDPAGMNWQKVN